MSDFWMLPNYPTVTADLGCTIWLWRVNCQNWLLATFQNHCHNPICTRTQFYHFFIPFYFLLFLRSTLFFCFHLFLFQKLVSFTHSVPSNSCLIRFHFSFLSKVFPFEFLRLPKTNNPFSRSCFTKRNFEQKMSDLNAPQLSLPPPI